MKFAIDGYIWPVDGGALYAAFGNSIDAGTVTRAEAQAHFDGLAIGETLVDEDGDTWERVE